MVCEDAYIFSKLSHSRNEHENSCSAGCETATSRMLEGFRR